MSSFAIFLPFIEKSVNQYLSLDPESANRLMPLTNKMIRFDINGLNFSVYMTVEASRLKFQETYQGEPNTIIKGSPFSLLSLSVKKTSATSFRDSGVEIQGDVDLGQQAKAIFDEMDIDWEEYLSKITGDVVAHQMGSMFKACSHYGQTVAESMSKNFTEVMQEEARHFPPREEINDFLADIDTLRDGVERLEARIKNTHMKTI